MSALHLQCAFNPDKSRTHYNRVLATPDPMHIEWIHVQRWFWSGSTWIETICLRQGHCIDEQVSHAVWGIAKWCETLLCATRCMQLVDQKFLRETFLQAKNNYRQAVYLLPAICACMLLHVCSPLHRCMHWLVATTAWCFVMRIFFLFLHAASRNSAPLQTTEMTKKTPFVVWCTYS